MCHPLHMHGGQRSVEYCCNIQLYWGVFYLALASFHLGTLCVRFLPTQYPTNNHPPSRLNISTNNRWMGTFYVAILCACMVGKHLCSMVVLFYYLGAGSSW
jgi:hypothetical protein